MSNILVAFLAAIGAATWTYSNTARRTGNNTQSAVVVASIVFGFAMLVMLSLLSMLDKSLS